MSGVLFCNWRKSNREVVLVVITATELRRALDGVLGCMPEAVETVASHEDDREARLDWSDNFRTRFILGGMVFTSALLDAGNKILDVLARRPSNLLFFEHAVPNSPRRLGFSSFVSIWFPNFDSSAPLCSLSSSFLSNSSS